MRVHQFKIFTNVLQKNVTDMPAEGSLGVCATPESTSLPLSQLTEVVVALYSQLCQLQKLYFLVTLSLR
jgi:hypothetical protein